MLTLKSSVGDMLKSCKNCLLCKKERFEGKTVEMCILQDEKAVLLSSTYVVVTS